MVWQKKKRNTEGPGSRIQSKYYQKERVSIPEKELLEAHREHTPNCQSVSLWKLLKNHRKREPQVGLGVEGSQKTGTNILFQKEGLIQESKLQRVAPRFFFFFKKGQKSVEIKDRENQKQWGVTCPEVANLRK